MCLHVSWWIIACRADAAGITHVAHVAHVRWMAVDDGSYVDMED